MRINRTTRTRFFTNMGNEVLRDARLSFCARGVLGYLLSLPDGHRADIRTLAERTPEGRERVAAALRELERIGYLRRTVKRAATGRLYTEVEVTDTPGASAVQVAPKTDKPGSGDGDTSADGDHPRRNRGQEPTHPDHNEMLARHAANGSEPEAVEAVAVLARVARAEPRLRLGESEVRSLVPLLAAWRRHGTPDGQIVSVLTTGLPPVIHCPAALVSDRLRRKMPPAAPPTRTVAMRWECEGCGVPVTAAGRCRSCRHVDVPHAASVPEPRLRGVALARAMLRGSAPAPA